MKYGRYQVVDELGKGAMGVVYRAHDPQINRPIALKALKPDLVSDDYFVKRFFREAVAIGRLSHPNIVTVYDVGQDHGTIYIAMEFLTGRPLNEWMREDALNTNEIVDIGAQLAEALDYAHHQGVVHRDIKPANIIMTDEKRPKLTDFGIAHIEDPAATVQTQAGEILGTPIYMSPEQAMGATPDGRSDLYSLGVILYELSTGRRPFQGNSMAMIFKAVVDETPEKPHIVKPSLPPSFSRLVMKSLEKDPDKRFKSGREMAHALRACLVDDVAATDQSQIRQPLFHRRWIAAMAFSAIAIFVTAIIAWQMNIPSPTPKTESPPRPSAPITGASLSISSIPLDARVYINGTIRGKTPLEITLPLGTYDVRMSKQDYFDWESQINLDKPETVPISVELAPLAF